MSDDIVSRLRNGVYGLNRIPLCEEAADEIERLRASQAPAADERADFEAWVRAQTYAPGISLYRRDMVGSARIGEYIDTGVEFAWLAWQASRSGAVHAAPNADQAHPAVQPVEATAARAADERSLPSLEPVARWDITGELLCKVLGPSEGEFRPWDEIGLDAQIRWMGKAGKIRDALAAPGASPLPADQGEQQP